ncbi:transposase family protein [Streptomyces sp. NPDC086835]|uniref:transposase family protein n=1 Tax=Streptomyces sp. NPDC086835 TaxID=3365761 RepID=UPI0038191202
MLDVPHEVAEHVSWLIYARRCDLNAGARSLLVLGHLRKDGTLAQVAAEFGVSTATVGRYVTEMVEIPAEPAPIRHEALCELPPEGFVSLDGTLIARPRGKSAVLLDEAPPSRDERAGRGRPGGGA